MALVMHSNINDQHQQLPSVSAGGTGGVWVCVCVQYVCAYSTYLISPFFKITKANVGINLASVYLNGARGMSAGFRPANHIHWSRFTVGTDRKREMIIHVSVMNGQIAPVNPHQVKYLNSTLFSRRWDGCQKYLFRSDLLSLSCLMPYVDEKFTTEPE